MMLVVADANDPQHNRQPARQSEPIDAEIVDERPDTAVTTNTGSATDTTTTGSTPPSSPQNDEQFRQYQQFLEFQKFQEWRRQQGEDDTATGGGGTGGGGTDWSSGATTRPWWKKALGLLRYKFIRRLLYLFVVLLLIWGYIHYAFGGGDDSGEGPSGGGIPGNQNPKQASVRHPSPAMGAKAIYNYIAYLPDAACDLLGDKGKAQFAADNGAPDCVTAARRLHSQVTMPTRYANPGFAEGAVQANKDTASVSSCKLTVEGGPKLGFFDMTKDAKNTWLIDGHQNEPADCVTG